METNGNTHQDSMIGRRIGVYELKREVGRGGMGTVYLAERADGEFYQTVAVKLIKRGMDTDLILKRFRRERQILAALNHPNIAYFLGGGSTEDGLPYFVMEFIEGAPLYRFCDKNNLNAKEKLGIFLQICDAVEAAHQIKVVHRDLKPSNILVKANGKPKLLDFGIAKVLDSELSATEIDPTATQMPALTPEYASPEQIRGEAVTSASDIYSLGVVLFEILTGHRPYYLKRNVPHEAARMICEDEPLKPSSLIVRSLSELNRPAAIKFQNIESPSEETIEGDLEKIILKALRKKPSERYQNAAELAADVTNYLENRRVNAEHFTPTAKPSAVKRTNEKDDNHSIAVLPFQLLSALEAEETGDAFLGIGLSDALVSRLSGVQRLVVRPTSSALSFAEKDPFYAGQSLNVDYVLDGKIRRVGDRIRVTIQLLDINANSTRWAEKFDEKFTDVLEFEDAISERVAKSLITNLTGDELKKLKKRPTDNVEAYKEYLRGRYYWNHFTVQGFAKALESYNRAVEIAPDYALAYAGIADYYNFLGVYAVRPFAETTAASKKAALKAIELDDSLAEAYAALGFAAQMGDFDWETAEKYLLRAIELNPNYVIGRVWYCYQLGMKGKFDEALEQINRALELDALTPIVPQTLNWVLYHARRYDEAIAATSRLIESEPNYGLSYVFLSSALWRVERFGEAIKMAKRAADILGRSPYTLCWLASAYAAAGRREKSFEIIAEIERLAANYYVSPYLLAMVYCNLGDKEKAFAQLDKALEIRDGRLNWLAIDPQFDVLRDDSRYQAILRAANNPLYQAAQSAENDATVPTIAVLPLKAISFGGAEDTEDRFLSFGLADALITRLTNIKRIGVRPTSSVLHYGNYEPNPFSAGRELNVDYVLDGSFRRSGARVRVSMQLLDIKKNTTRWAKAFDERSTDFLELEDSISGKVAESLISSLTGEERQKISKRGTSNAEAYETYLRGRYYWNQFTPDSLPKALAAFQKAVELDPNFALAYVGLADFYNWAIIYGILPPTAYYEKSAVAASRAIELDENLSEAYASLALVKEGLWEWDESERLYQKAIELNPNYSLAHEWYSSLLMGIGKLDEGLKKIRYAESLDPLSTRAMTLTCWQSYQARDYAAAIAKALQIQDLDKNYPQSYLQLGNVLIHVGRTEESVKNARIAAEMTPDSALPKYSLCFALIAANRRDEAQEVLRAMKSLAEANYVKPYFLAMAHLAFEEYDRAFEYFELAFAERDPWITWFGTEPKLDAVRRDPRYIKLFQSTGNPFAFR